MEKTVIKPLSFFKAVVFDFDNTLFLTEKIKVFFRKIAALHGFTAEETLALYQAAREDNGVITITMENFLRVIRRALAERKMPFLEKETNILAREMECCSWLAPGAKKILEFCQHRGLERYLLSLGVREWQEQKVRRAGVVNYFLPNNIIYATAISTGKREALQNLFGEEYDGAGLILFNDKPDETRSLAEAFPKLIALIRREPADQRYTNSDFIALTENFSGRVAWSEELLILFDTFKSLLPPV